MTVLGEVSAILEMFRSSAWRDLHLRTPRYALFLANEGGAANPMLDRSAAADLALSAASAIVRAPHVATVVSLKSPGAQVLVGEPVAELEVLGEPVTVLAPHAGAVGVALAPVGALVEYGAPLVTIVGF